MLARAIAAAAFIAAVSGVAAAAEGLTVDPQSGPPGTTVVLWDIGECHGDPDEMVFASSEGRNVGAEVVPLTSPTATIVVPHLPDGLYQIRFSCGAGEGFVPFTMAAQAIRATPSFTG